MVFLGRQASACCRVSLRIQDEITVRSAAIESQGLEPCLTRAHRAHPIIYLHPPELLLDDDKFEVLFRTMRS